MMKKTFKQLLGLALSAAMVISMVGCGQETTKETEKETQVVSKETEATQVTESEAVEETGITYPLDSDETITIWTHRLTLNSEYDDPSKSPFHSGLSKNVGVNFEFSFPQQGQGATAAYNLVLTEDVLPDVFFKSYNPAMVQELYDDGLIYDLTPYLQEYAPDYWAFLTAPENKDFYRSAVSEDGKILAFFAARESEFGITYSGPIIRQDWLDECGLPAPVTFEDWENVLTTFKEKYNATLCFDASCITHPFFASGAGAYGTAPNNGSDAFYIDDNGELQLIQTQPEWVEYMKTLNKWYEAGLIDNDSMAINGAAVRTKAANNQVGASFGSMSMLTNMTVDAENNGSNAKWVGISYPRTAAGEPTSMIQHGLRNMLSGAVITTDCPEDKLITVIKALNYGYTEEGIMYYNFGEEGVSYTLDSEGNPQWTDLVLNDPQGISVCINKYTGAHAAPIGIQLDKHVQKKNAQVATDAVNAWIENSEASKHYVPMLSLTTEESLAYTDKFTAIDTYIKEMTQKFIMGTESLDEIDAFYKELNKMGLQECLKIQRDALARYMSN